MGRFCFILPAILLSLMVSCATSKQSTKTEQTSPLIVDGTVQESVMSELSLVLNFPEIKRTANSTVEEIAQQVIQKSLFLEGLKTEINGLPAIVKEIRGKTVDFVLDKPQPMARGVSVKVKIPKKTIAIMDFEVIRGPEREVGRVFLESLTSLLIDSGNFVVVEREKLKTILREQELTQTGLTQETKEGVVGKLLMADLVLTGTLAELGGIWDINIRLVDVRKGQALVAIAKQTPSIFGTVSEMRDANPLHGDFAKGIDPGWSLGYRKLDSGFYSVYLDPKAGLEGSKGSLRMDFDLPAGIRGSFAQFRSDQRRDLSLYEGVEFYIRATRPLFGTFNLITSHPDDSNKIAYWVGNFEIGTEWKIIRLPFNKLVNADNWITREPSGSQRKLGDKTLRPSRIEGLRIGVWSTRNPPCSGSIWVDKIRSYK